MVASLTLPGMPDAAAGFDAPFEMLAACHDRVRRSLSLLERLSRHINTCGVDAQARSAAKDVLRYFGVAAPAHHEDEERHVVPVLFASGDPEVSSVAQRLLDDHVRIRACWAVLEPMLEAVAGGDCPDATAFADAARDFVDIHADHLRIEDELAFPQAARMLAAGSDDALYRIGCEMAERRGVARPERKR